MSEDQPQYNKSEQAKASSNNARLNIPLNLNNWKSLEEPVQNELVWFHQYLLDQNMSLKDAGEAIGYDGSVVFKALKGTYEGSWANITKAIKSYRKIAETRGTIQAADFAENKVTKMIFAGLDYAMANNSMTLIMGESGQGKTIAGRAWKEAHNHGRTAWVTAPVVGGDRGLLREICRAIGANKNQASVQMAESIYRAFNKNRMLIIDEAIRLLPKDGRSTPTKLEFIRDLHDNTGCAIALIATARFSGQLTGSQYQYEQVLGRISMPITLHDRMTEKDYLPILSQYIPDPSDKLLKLADQISNERGRLRSLTELLKVSSRIAGKQKKKLTEDHIYQAHQVRLQMMGQNQHALTVSNR